MTRMNKQIAFLLINVLVTCPLRGQVSAIIPPHARDSLAAADARSPIAQRNRQRSLDSLAAGRRRWALARIAEYQLQVHEDCFCVPHRDSAPQFPLVIIRRGAIVGHARGRTVGGSINVTTIDSLFTRVERDLRDPGRVVRQLDLDTRYGFPRNYYAETPSIPDLWLSVHVDSFAVTRADSATVHRPPNDR